MNSPVSLTPLQRAQLNFWSGFQDYARKHARRITPTAPQPDTWMFIAIGKTGFGLNAVASTVSWDGSGYTGGLGIRAEFLILDSRPFFDKLREEQHRIQAEFGEQQLIWFSKDRVKQCKVFLQRRVDWREAASRHQCYEWLVQNLDRLHEVFAPLVRGPGIWDLAKVVWQKIKERCRW
ncbi:MAG: DUF4268 domain-containing protein [Acidobacteriota bacterium]|nr:DUF4268 domain-containing protein [Acidobacteriota bacterium]